MQKQLNDLFIKELINCYQEVFLAFMVADNELSIISENTMGLFGMQKDLFFDVDQWHTFIHPYDLEACFNFAQAKSDISTRYLTFRIRLADGKYRPVIQKRIDFKNDSTGINVQLYVFFTEKVNNSVEKGFGQISYQRYQTLVDSIDNIIFQTDKDGCIRFLNQRWSSVMGYEISEVLGKPLINYTDVDDYGKTVEIFDQMANNVNETYHAELLLVGKARKRVWVKLYAITMKDETGSIVGISGTLQDITLDKQNRILLDMLVETINQQNEAPGQEKQLA